MIRWDRAISISVILLLLSFAFSLPLSAGQEDGRPFIGEDDDYAKEVEVGGQTNFNWTVYKNVSGEVAVRVNVEGFGNCEKSVSPQFFILDEDTKYKVVTLKIRLSESPERRVEEGDISFSFRRLDEEEPWFEETKHARIDITGLPPVESENTIVGGFENPLPAPLDGPAGAFLLNVSIWLGIAFLIFFMVTPIIYQLTKKTETDLDDLLVKMIRRPILILVFLYGLIHSILRLNISFNVRATLYRVYSLLVLIIGVYVAYQILHGVLQEISVKRGGESTPFANILKPVFEKIGAIVILLGGLIIGLRIMGIQVTALLAGAGVLGLVVAFAAQDTLSNFFSGIHLLLDRPFTVGDVLQLETGEFCRVKDVGMRSTRLYNIRDHEMIVLPNNTLANQKIVNVAEPDTMIRVVVNVGVAYGSDIKGVKKILYEVLEDHDDIMHEEGFEPIVRFSEFGDSSLNFTVRFWVDHYMKQWDVASDIRNKIDSEFREAEVTIPFPQRTVWLKDEEKAE